MKERLTAKVAKRMIDAFLAEIKTGKTFSGLDILWVIVLAMKAGVDKKLIAKIDKCVAMYANPFTVMAFAEYMKCGSWEEIDQLSGIKGAGEKIFGKEIPQRVEEIETDDCVE